VWSIAVRVSQVQCGCGDGFGVQGWPRGWQVVAAGFVGHTVLPGDAAGVRSGLAGRGWGAATWLIGVGLVDRAVLLEL
jgi:hypothetical protein